jgi:hypothetical protein
MLVAIKSGSPPKMTNKESYLNEKLKTLWKDMIEDDVPILTDSYSPIEQYMVEIYRNLQVRNIKR